MKIKYKTTIYNKRNPYGIEKTCISEGEKVEKPDYLIGCDNCIFLKNNNNHIFIIDPEKIIKVF